MDRKSLCSTIATAGVTLLIGLAPVSGADYDDRYDEAVVVERAYTQHDVAIALTEQGFVAWDDIDWKHGVWRVDDARRVDGREYDLKLDPVTLAVIWSDRDQFQLRAIPPLPVILGRARRAASMAGDPA